VKVIIQDFRLDEWIRTGNKKNLKGGLHQIVTSGYEEKTTAEPERHPRSETIQVTVFRHDNSVSVASYDLAVLGNLKSDAFVV
jgi:hypothetical protein